MFRHLFPLFIAAIVASPILAGIEVKSSYTYDQRGVLSFEGEEEIVGSIERTIRLPNATYKFDIGGASDNVYELKSKAKFEVDIDGRAINGNSGDGWDRTNVRAFHSAQLVDTAIVEGVQGEISGVIEFLWDVTGSSNITVDPKLSSDAYFIDDLFTTSFFNTLEDNGTPELLLNNQSRPGGSSVDSTVGGFFEPVVVFVDWAVGEELDVFFELQTSAVLDVMNLDAAGFNALLSSDFSNTANFRAVNIYDQDGVLLEDARLVGQGGFVYDPPTAVPEPSSASLLLGLACFLVGCRSRRRDF